MSGVSGTAAIRPFRTEDAAALVALSLRAWAPVFEAPRDPALAFVYGNFYPGGWQARQAADVARLLEDAADRTWVAEADGGIAGFVTVALHPEDRMGEIAIVAVDPALQRRGIGRALLRHGEGLIREAGMAMCMVETVGDAGHAPARRAYEAAGYRRWPVARYFKDLG